MVKTKICGITNFEDALASISAGCDALGFAFFKKSPRYITPQKAKRIIRQLPKGIIKIGVFVNAHELTVKRIARLCNLDILQFHGNESAQYCSKFKNYKIIKVFRIKDKAHLPQVLKFHPFAFLFDTFIKGKMGGTGKKFDWKLIRHIDGLRSPIFLSGGLSARNVCKAIEAVKPDWVDVCSSIESFPGKKDPRKVKEFIKQVKKYS